MRGRGEGQDRKLEGLELGEMKWGDPKWVCAKSWENK